MTVTVSKNIKFCLEFDDILLNTQALEIIKDIHELFGKGIILYTPQFVPDSEYVMDDYDISFEIFKKYCEFVNVGTDIKKYVLKKTDRWCFDWRTDNLIFNNQDDMTLAKLIL